MMDDLGIVQPRCPSCGVVMRDHPKGFQCPECGLADDLSKKMDAVVIPPDFDGPSIHGG